MNAKKRPVPRLFAGELEILQMLWREGAVTILEAQQRLGLPIGYTTVQTRLNRLDTKGVAIKSKGRPAKYSAGITPEDVRRTDLDLLVDRVSNGRVLPLVAHLLSSASVSQDELNELKVLITKAQSSLDREKRRAR